MEEAEEEPSASDIKEGFDNPNYMDYMEDFSDFSKISCELGDEFYAQEDYTSAINHYSNAINVLNQPKVLLKRSTCYLKLQRYEESYEDALNIMKKVQIDASCVAAFQCAKIELALGNPSHVLDLLSHLQMINPDIDNAAQNQLSKLKKKADHYLTLALMSTETVLSVQAMPSVYYLESSLIHAKDHSLILLQLAILYTLTNKLDLAIKYASKVIFKGEHLAAAYYILGMSYLYNNDKEMAMISMQKSLKIKKTRLAAQAANKIEGFYGMLVAGDKCFEERRLPGALAQYASAAKCFTRSERIQAYLYYKIAKIYYEIDALAPALGYLLCSAFHTRYVEAHIERARVYMKTNDLESAKLESEIAIELVGNILEQSNISGADKQSVEYYNEIISREIPPEG